MVEQNSFFLTFSSFYFNVILKYSLKIYTVYTKEKKENGNVNVLTEY